MIQNEMRYFLLTYIYIIIYLHFNTVYSSVQLSYFTFLLLSYFSIILTFYKSQGYYTDPTNYHITFI